MASGGTESILLAALAYREHAKKTRGVTQPEVVAAVTAHPAIHKACHYFGMKLVQVPVDATLRLRVEDVATRINENTVLIYASAPTFPLTGIPSVLSIPDASTHADVHALVWAHVRPLMTAEVQAAGDAGNLMMLSGVGITTHTRNQAAAEKLVDFLLSDEAQTYFATKVYEYPVRGAIARHPDVPALSEHLVAVEQAHLTDVSRTVSMLRDLDLN